MLRPRIEASIAQREGQAYLLKCWLKQNLEHEHVPEADAILSGIEHLMSPDSEVRRNPIEAATVWAPVAAGPSQARCSKETERRAIEVVSNAYAFSLEGLSTAEIDIFDHCLASVEHHPDYREASAVPNCSTQFYCGRPDFSKIVWKSRRRMIHRSRICSRHLTAPWHQESLQDDYFRWISTQSASGEMEPTNLGGGRADVALKATGNAW